MSIPPPSPSVAMLSITSVSLIVSASTSSK